MLHNITTKKNIRTFSISAENLTGEKGKGGMATTGTGAGSACDLGQGWKVSPYFIVNSGTKMDLADVKGQGAIKHIWVACVDDIPRGLILRIYFDGKENPAVEAPLTDFFCNTDPYDYRQLSSLAMCVNPLRGMNCYFEMPYFTGFRVEVENISPKNTWVYYQIDCEEKKIDPDSLYFHAQFRRTNPLPYKESYVILDNIKGYGQYVGTFMHWGAKSRGWWGEGEVKFYIDGDSEFPSICGTGTEDYFLGSHAFCRYPGDTYVEFSTPYSGMPKVSTQDQLNHSQLYFDLYRWHLPDPIYFKEDLRVTVQALGWRNDGRYRPLQDDISSVAYWYSDNLDDIYPTFPNKDELEI